MQDVIYLALTTVFFVGCIAYIRGLDRMVKESEHGEDAAVIVDAESGNGGVAI